MKEVTTISGYIKPSNNLIVSEPSMKFKVSVELESEEKYTDNELAELCLMALYIHNDITRSIFGGNNNVILLYIN